MKNHEILAKGKFQIEYNLLLKFFGFPSIDTKAKALIFTKTKEEFLALFPSTFNTDSYDLYKEFEDFFALSDTLSFVDFSNSLYEKYGFFLNRIKETEQSLMSTDIKTIKNIMVFITIIWILGTIAIIAILFN